MNASRGYYSLVQYCPDASRLEAANVGVLLFCPERRFVRAKTIRSSERISRLFRPDYDIDAQYIRILQEGIEDAISIEGPDIHTLEDLEAFIGGLANEVRLTTPRPMRVESPDDELDGLLQTLVLGQRASNAKGGRNAMADTRETEAAVKPVRLTEAQRQKRLEMAIARIETENDWLDERSVAVLCEAVGDEPLAALAKRYGVSKPRYLIVLRAALRRFLAGPIEEWTDE